MEATRFKQYRPDGWPFCPSCGEDELLSCLLQVSPKQHTVAECLQHGFLCLFCGWTED